MKKSTIPIIVLLAIAIVAVVILIGRSKSPIIVGPPTSPTQPVQPTQTTLIGETSPTTQPSQPTKLTPTTTIQPSKAIQCTTGECFLPHFLKCAPVELKMPFIGDTIYQIIVFGIKDGKCHHTTKVVDSSGKAVSGGPPTLECFVPVDKITTATAEHLFGVDTAVGKETVKAEQDQLFTDYCVQQ